MAILIEVGKSFRANIRCDLDSLTEKLDLPEAIAVEAIQQLLADGYLQRILDDEGEQAGYTLAKSPQDSRLAEVLVARRDVVRSESIKPIRELLRMSMRETTLEAAIKESLS